MQHICANVDEAFLCLAKALKTGLMLSQNESSIHKINQFVIELHILRQTIVMKRLLKSVY
jgi:hypothetical protein